MYEVMTDVNGRQVLVNPASIKPQHAAAVDGYNGNDSSMLRNTPVQGQNTQPPGRIELRRGPDGNIYQVRAPATPVQSQQQHGQYVPVQTVPCQSQPQPGQFQVLDASVASGNESQLLDRIQGIVRITDAGGASKKSKLLDYAKKCPTKWAKDTKPANINLALYGYAALAELESLLASGSDSLTDGQVLGRVRHVKNVFEVCCVNSDAKDFSSYGWVLARDYATKVENKVDQGVVDWQGMPVGVQTADLVLAQCEYPRPQKPETKKEVNLTGGQKLCTTYNQCSTADKCDYEVSNPDRNCLRRHECSYCRKHFKQGYRHQEVRCAKKRDGVTGK